NRPAPLPDIRQCPQRWPFSHRHLICEELPRMRLNACELEIDLMCRGLRIPEHVSLEGARGISRTRAGLGSGLEIVIPTNSWLKRRVWMNAPVTEDFAAESPYALDGSPSVGYGIVDSRSGMRYT